MNKKTKLLASVMTFILVLSCLAGCSKTNKPQQEGASSNTNPNAKEIIINYWNTGLGSEWLEQTRNAFEKKYPEYKVTYNASANMSAVTPTLGKADIDQVDLYMSIIPNDASYLVSLDDVLDSTADGDKKTLREKIDTTLLEASTSADGHVYSLTIGGGVISLAYNDDLFKKAGVTQIPRTTDELVTVCDTLYGKDIVPLCHYAGGGYYDYIVSLYMVQYEGFEYYKNTFYACKDSKGNSPSKDVLMAKDSRYYTLKALEKVITPEYTLVGSNSKSHTEIQTEFAAGKAAMMVNGSWLKNEIKGLGADQIKSMRMPVLSAITNKLTTVNNDYLLREVITAIDAVTNGEKKLSDYESNGNYIVDGMMISVDDWNKIEKARNSVASNMASQGTFIPDYSDNIEGAKKFIEFMNSDEGLKIYHEVNKMPKPITLSTGEEFDLSGATEFEKMQFELAGVKSYIVEHELAARHNIFKFGGATPLAKYNFPAVFSTNNVDSRLSADEVWTAVLKLIDEQYDNSWLPNIQ